MTATLTSRDKNLGAYEVQCDRRGTPAIGYVPLTVQEAGLVEGRDYVTQRSRGGFRFYPLTRDSQSKMADLFLYHNWLHYGIRYYSPERLVAEVG